jgi:imidazole glycerol-phosphate synthase subunit HisH
MGNVRSVYNAISLLGEQVIITDDKDKISNAEAIILPGVGSFYDGMNNLEQKGLLELLNEEIIEKKKPYLGICLGLEFLAKTSCEGGEHKGFGWLNGTIEKITPKVSNLKVPHMGWDETKVLKNDGLLKDLIDPSFYYLHSYYFKVDKNEKEFVTSICDYGGVPIVSTIQKGNIYGVQFHPEKSQIEGIKLLKNFIDDIRRKNVKT